MPMGSQKSRRKALSWPFLNVALVAWLSIAAIPCSVLSPGAIASEHQAAETHPTDCHGMHVEVGANNGTDCCCHPVTSTAPEPQKTQRADWVAVTSSIPPPTTPSFAPVEQDNADLRPPLVTAPPVYLATQRIRI